MMFLYYIFWRKVGKFAYTTERSFYYLICIYFKRVSPCGGELMPAVRDDGKDHWSLRYEHTTWNRGYWFREWQNPSPILLVSFFKSLVSLVVCVIPFGVAQFFLWWRINLAKKSCSLGLQLYCSCKQLSEDTIRRLFCLSYSMRIWV